MRVLVCKVICSDHRARFWARTCLTHCVLCTYIILSSIMKSGQSSLSQLQMPRWSAFFNISSLAHYVLKTLSSLITQEDPMWNSWHEPAGLQEVQCLLVGEEWWVLTCPCITALFIQALFAEKESSICSLGEQMIIQHPMVLHQRRLNLKTFCVSVYVMVFNVLHL